MASQYDKPWAHLYHTARWRARRKEQLRREPLCAMCLEDGDLTPATISDHVKRHDGDEALFWHGALQSLCKTHHDSSKSRQERRGYIGGCDGHGNPKDPEHRWRVADRATSARITALIRPVGLKPSAIPLTIVCGPAGGGKSTYVAQHAAQGDTIIDMDIIRADLGIGVDDWDTGTLERSLTKRNELLNALTQASAGSAWFIVSAAPAHERVWWTQALKPRHLVIVLANAKTCIERIKATRTGERAERASKASSKWWTSYSRRIGETEIDTGGLVNAIGSRDAVPMAHLRAKKISKLGI